MHSFQLAHLETQSDSMVHTLLQRHHACTEMSVAVTMGAGVQWGEIYALADQHNRSIAGGFSPGGTVGKPLLSLYSIVVF
jgi:hypothetical protein